MKLEQRIEKLEKASAPVENVADAIRRTYHERRAGTYRRPTYVPGQSVLLDAIHKRRIARGETL